MECSYEVRPAGPQDSVAILAMLGRLAKHEGAALQPRLTEASLLRDVFCDAPRAHIFVAESEETVLIGFILVFETYSSWEGGAALHIGDLWVEEGARSLGVGSRLVSHALGAFPNRRVDVYVVRSNDARAFYERCGFIERADWCLYRRN
jgi:GNAT superfamily N-acetyltransferase